MGCTALNAVLASMLAASGAAFDLTIVHWNDVHARNTPANEQTKELCLEEPYSDPACYGGHAQIATICQQAKASSTATLCIDGGDEFWGSEWDVLYEGSHTGAVLEAVGTDAMVVGNHEFDFGVPVLAEFIEGVGFPMLGACNMDTAAQPSLNILKWQVFDLQGVKVALLGYTLRATATTSFSQGVTFSNPVRAVPQCIQDFEASPDSDGVDIIGLVSHAGLETDIQVARSAQGVDFIISAHSHTAMFPDGVGQCLAWADGACTLQDTSEYEYPHMVGEVPILQQYWASKYAGVATLAFDDAGVLTNISAESIPLGTYYSAAGEEITVEGSEAVKALQSSGFQEVKAFAEAEMATLPEELSAAEPAINMQEMPLGNAICDSLIHSLSASGLRNFEETEGTPLVSVFNSARIRKALPAGSVTFADIKAVLPFGGFVVVLEVTGGQLRAALELAYDSVTDTNPPDKFLHLGGGLTVEVDSSQPAGGRLQAMQHDCTDISDTATLHLATNNFAAARTSEYAPLQGVTRLVPLGPDLSTALADYLAANTEADGTVADHLITPDGRYADISDPTVVPQCDAGGTAATASTEVEEDDADMQQGVPEADAAVPTASEAATAPRTLQHLRSLSGMLCATAVGILPFP